MVAFLRARTKLAALAASLITLAVIAFVNARFSEPVLAVSDGSPYVVDLVDDTNPDPNIVETTITAQAAAVDVASGVTASVLTFNGTVPGPEFRLKVGDTVIVHFKNDIAHATGIHWHGIELANASDGTPLTQNMVEPGDTFLYKFKVTRPGIYWYHPHHHSSTNQVFKGMYGSIIVTDPAQDSLQGTVLPSAADTMTMVLSDLTVCKAADSNDTSTYNTATQPHVSGGALPAQNGPTPKALCEAAPDGEALDEDGAPRGDYLAGDVPNIQKAAANNQPVNEGQTVLTNGMNVGPRGGSPSAPGSLDPLAFKKNVLAGQGLRMQLVNAATTRFFRLILTTAAGVQVPLIRVGGQGGVLNLARVEGGVAPSGFDFKYTTGEILLDPGDRADIVAVIPAGTEGTVLTMWTQDFGRSGGGAVGYTNIPTVPVAHFNVTGAAGTPYVLAPGDPLRGSLAPADQVQALGAATINLLDPATDFSPAKTGMSSEDIRLTQVPGGTPSLGIDDKQGHHDFGVDYTAIGHEDSARYAAAIGGTLELTVTNTTTAHHPFHLHGFSIQPLSLTQSGQPTYTFDYPEFRDNIDIPKRYTLHFRVRLDDRPLMDGVTPGGGLGRWVFHCHIFFHAVFGMISEFNVVAADGNERPHINADDTLIQGDASDALVMHGTYSDPDGDTPIGLTASAGTITDDGDGSHWTWTQTGAVSGLVYVTATDPDGLKDQVAFALDVNQPPTLVLPAAQTGAYTDSLSFGISATDPDAGDTIVLGASGLPTALGFVDNLNRTGTVSGTLTALPNLYVATFTANDGHNDTVSANLNITVEKETTVLTYTGPTVILNGGMVTLTATLLEDDGPPVVGKTVNFALGAQLCSGVTNASGVASCNIAVVTGALGPKTIATTFTGDAYYKASADSDTAIVFAFPTRGAFVLGNNTATGNVTFWSSSWSSVNALSGGSAPSAFKGFAGTVTLPNKTPPTTCAVPWSTLGGNSPPPTDVVPAYMGVLVSSAVSKSGNVISGNTTRIVVVQVNSAPGPSSPGKVGTGTVVGVFCQ